MKQLEASGIEVAELHVSKATLEDVFLELTASLSCQPSAESEHLRTQSPDCTECS